MDTFLFSLGLNPYFEIVLEFQKAFIKRLIKEKTLWHISFGKQEESKKGHITLFMCIGNSNLKEITSDRIYLRPSRLK